MEFCQDEIFFGDFVVFNKMIEYEVYVYIQRGGGGLGVFFWKFFWICVCRNYLNKVYNKDGSL